MLGALMLVILLGSINYDNALGYLLAFLLFGLFLIGVLHTYRNLTGLSFTGAQAKPVFFGAAAAFNLSIDNSSSWERYSVDITHWPRTRRRWWRRRRPATSNQFTATLPAAKLSTIPLKVIARQRGWLALERVRIASVFPLGILRSWGYFESDVKCLVYPRPSGQLALPIRSHAAGSNHTGATPGNDDFAGFRAYRPGDTIRAISWKSLAKQDAVIVKRFTGGGADRVDLKWEDCSALVDPEAKLSQMSLWVIEAQKRGMIYGLEIPGLTMDPSNGTAHQHACLQALALFHLP